MRRFVLLAAFLLVVVPAATAAPSEPQTIIAVGYASEEIVPDHATVDIGVVTSDKVATKALKANNALMQRVLEAVKGLGVKESEMQTCEFSITPLHPKLKDGYNEDESITLGYQVVNKLTISLTELDKVGVLIDAAVNAGANTSNNVSFDVKNGQALEDKVLADAIKDARHNAEVIAAAEHAKVGKMVSATTVSNFLGEPMNALRPDFFGGLGGGMMVLAGSVKVSARVQVTFALED